jgi:hypothetical protein
MGLFESIFGGDEKVEDDLEESQKGMGYGELILDNVIGLDNDYDSFGEKLGRTINEDEIGFVKQAGQGIYEGAKDFIKAPIETTKEAVKEVATSTKDLFTKGLDERLQEMYGVDITTATGDQITAAREGVMSDALGASALIPAAGVGIKGAKVIANAMPEVEFDPNTVGMNMGNVSFKPKDSKDETVPATVADQTENMLDIDRRVDTRIPTQAVMTKGPMAGRESEDFDKVGSGTLISDGAGLAQNFNNEANFKMIIEGYPGFNKLWSDDVAETQANITNRMTENIVSLYDMSDKLGIAEESAQWYKGANRIALGLANRFGVSDTKTAGVLAALSPGKDWFQNVAMAERIIKHNAELGPNAPWTSEMSAVSNTVKASAKGDAKTAWQKQPEFENVVGRPWGDMETPMEKALWIRAYDEAHFGSNFREVSPDGDLLGYDVNKAGSPSTLVHQSFPNMEKAIRILDGDGGLDSISPDLGNAHKVRNFFNNILNPDSPKDVTVDTHQIAAGLFRPLGQKATEVAQGLSGANVKGDPRRWSNAGDKLSGTSGSYGLYFDATSEAAKLRGVLPREMQSVSWEQLRTLFPKTLKANKSFVSSVEAVWNMVDEGILTSQAARERIIEIADDYGAGGQNLVPSWKSFDGKRRDIGIATAGLMGAAGLATAEEAPAEEEGFATPQ